MLAGVKNMPLDLNCKPIRCWVYVPACGLGNPGAPNEVQLFVKDAQGRSAYGTPLPVARDGWFEVGLRPSTVAPVGGYVDPRFNPRAIRLLGVRYGAGGEGASYQGKLYLDACGWEEIDAGLSEEGTCSVDFRRADR